MSIGVIIILIIDTIALMVGSAFLTALVVEYMRYRRNKKELEKEIRDRESISGNDR